MTTTDHVAPTQLETDSPELIDSWVLVTLFEVLILFLISPALFRVGAIWGVAALAMAALLAAVALTLRRGMSVGYQLLTVLHPISLLALLGAAITFLTIAPPVASIIAIVLLYLSGFLRHRQQRGYAILLQAIVVLTAIIALVAAPEESLSRIFALLALVALYLFTGGAVRFYFGHSFADLDRPGVYGYFGYRQLPTSRQAITQLFNRPGQVLRVTYGALDGVFKPRTQSRPRAGGAWQRLQVRSGASNASRTVTVAAIIVGVIVFPYLIRALEGRIDISILISMNVGLLFVVLALGLNIVVGFAGLLDLGYAAFFAIGAYTVGVFTWPNLGLEWSFWIVILISAGVAAIFGLIIGAPTLRLRGDYLAIVTLAFGEIVPRAIREFWNIKLKIPFTDIYILSEKGWFYNSQGKFVEGFNLTNGPQGMNPVGRPTILGHEVGIDALTIGPINVPPPIQWYFLIAVIGAIVLFAAFRLERSRLGRAWMAIREDETAADAMGVDPVRTKLLAFALGASFSGFAGAIYAAMIQAIFPELFSFLVSIFLLIIVIVSGMGNIWGVLMGGVLISLFDRVILAQIVPEFIPGGDVLQRWRWVMYASGLIAIMVLRPEGLFPSAARRAELHEAEEGPSEEELAAILAREQALEREA